MIKTLRQQLPSRQGLIPNIEDQLASGLMKRCGVCWRLWSADEFKIEEGAVGTEERCPSCVDTRTSIEKAETLLEETEYAASREPPPQVSIAPLASTFPPTIVSMEHATTAAKVYAASPMRIIRGDTGSLRVIGRAFDGTETITAPTGLTVSVSSVVSSGEMVLSVAPAVSMTPGDHYGMTFEGVDFNNIFSIR